MPPGCCDVRTDRGNSGWERCPVCVSDELCWSGESRGVARRAAGGPPRQSPPLTPDPRRRLRRRLDLNTAQFGSAGLGAVRSAVMISARSVTTARAPAWVRALGLPGLVPLAHAAAPPPPAPHSLGPAVPHQPP